MMRRFWQLLIISSALLAAGCNTLSHAEAKLQASQRWSAIRAGVKYNLAEQHYEAGLFKDAVHTATEAIALDPTRAASYVLLAQANLELGKAATAEQVLDVAAEAGLDSAGLHYARGVILEQRSHLDAAEAEYARARVIDPRSIDALVAQAECLVALDRATEALTLLDENAERFDDDATVVALGAHVAALLGDADEALKRLRRAFAMESDNRLIAEELGRMLVRAGQCDESLSVLQPLLDSPANTDPRAQPAPMASGARADTSGAVRRAIATCHLSLGEPALARNILVDYVRSHPGDTLAQLLLAKAAIATNDILTALHAVDQAQQRAPNAPEVRLVRATISWKRGRLTAAAADLHNILTSHPGDVEAHCLLAEVLSGQHQPDAARAHFQLALELDPFCSWATAGLKWLRASTLPLDPGRSSSPTLGTAAAPVRPQP